MLLFNAYSYTELEPMGIRSIILHTTPIPGDALDPTAAVLTDSAEG